MEQVLNQFRSDKKLRDDCIAIYEAMGLDLNTAFRMFMERTRMVRGLPFPALFEACNILRGSINQDEYKSYVTPILLSDVYDEEIQTALEESNGDKEYAFFPENHRCGELGTSAYAAAELLTGEEFEGVSGKYFSMSTEPAKSSELSYSVEDAREFWEESEKLSVLRRK